jgi:hypothetical protein
MTEPTTVPWRPTPDDVHALIARRPAFTETSRPSLAEVELLISGVVGEIEAELTGPLPITLHGLARQCVAYGAASLVEQSFTPEQALGDEAPAAALYARYLALLARLRTLAAAVGVALDPSGGGEGTRTYRSGSVRTPSEGEIAMRLRYGYVATDDPYLAL